ncbi:MAG: glycosyltransferase family 2 protein [Planctomycetota bacterium]
MIIPTHGRPRKAAQCVRALATQTLDPDRYEVLVGLDGPDPDTEGAVTEAWPDAPPEALRVVTCRREGYNAVRNELLAMCRGRTLVSLNDDVRPRPEFLDVHRAEQQRGAEAGRPAIVVGLSPWVSHPADRLFDRLVRETSMVFFFDRMDDADPDRDWGFRHAWGLNVSMPAGAVSAVGGWTVFPLEYGYDDIEIAWRLRKRFDARVLYRRSALAPTTRGATWSASSGSGAPRGCSRGATRSSHATCSAVTSRPQMRSLIAGHTSGTNVPPRPESWHPSSASPTCRRPSWTGRTPRRSSR